MKKFTFAFLSILLVTALITLAGCTNTTTTPTSNSTTTTQATTPIQTSTTAAYQSPAPLITATDPPDGARNVPVNYLITATFASENLPNNLTLGLDPATINVNTFSLWLGTTPVSGVVTYVGSTAIFNPNSDLSIGATYTAKVTKGVADTTGVHMITDFLWNFVAGPADTVAPTVSGTTPSDGDLSVPSNNEIIAYFSEPMDPLSIDQTTFTLTKGTTAVVGTVSYDGNRTAVFNPSADLTPNTDYTAMITTGVVCAGGRHMTQNFSWTFNTGAAQTHAPTVISTIPNSTAGGVPINNSITVTFSEPMDPMTLNAATFTLWLGTTQVPGTVEFDGIDTAVFMPEVDLIVSQTYTAKLSTDITDAGGIHMANPSSWTFTTGVADTTIPAVTSVSPLNAATGVAINSVITVVFSEPMDPTSLVFSLMQGSNNVESIVTWNASGKTMTITPANPLLPNTQYSANFYGVTDLAGFGNANQNWTFTTAP